MPHKPLTKIRLKVWGWGAFSPLPKKDLRPLFWRSSRSVREPGLLWLLVRRSSPAIKTESSSEGRACKRALKEASSTLCVHQIPTSTSCLSTILTQMMADEFNSGVAPANQTKKGQFMNFSQGHSGTKVQCESCLFS